MSKTLVSRSPMFLLILILFLSSCADNHSSADYSVDERARIDSLVFADRSIDSLKVLADSFAYEDNDLGVAVACRELGKAYRNSSRFPEALDVHRRGLEAAMEIADTLQIVQAFNNIGTVYRRMGVLEEAASWHYRGLSICERWSDTTSVGLKNKVVSLNGLGNVLLSMGKDSLAMLTFREALKGEQKLGSSTGMAINYANIGALLEQDGQIDSARFYFTLSLEANMKAGSSLGISLCHSHFGRLFEKDGDYVRAFDEYKTAYDGLSGGSDKWHWLESCTSLARLSIRNDDPNAARRFLSEALPVAEALESSAHLADVYNLYYVLHRSEGRYKESLHWLESYSDCIKRLYDERNEDAIFELRSKYEREKSQHEMELLRDAHRQEVLRDRQLLFGSVITIICAFMAIILLVYYLRLRSRNNAILKALDETKSNYFTNVAHEFRTPLTIISSAARSIQDNAADEGLKEDAADISRHSDALLDLVNQVLDVAKMTSGIAPDPVWRNGNVAAFISGICERNARYAESKGIKLVYECSEEDFEMDFVPEMMVRIVQNLLSNALKFSGKGTEIHVVVARSDENLCVSVRDQGAGMTPSQMQEVFKPFYQAEGQFKDMGTGLGLSVVKLAAASMDGEVSLASEVGKGTEFIVTVPVRHDRATSSVCDGCSSGQTADIPSDAGNVADASGADQDVPRILIVEDVPEVARWEMRQLGGADYAFFFASDGSEGLRKAEDIVPDLIITDVSMPVMDGLEFCRKVRESELLCHVPVVMVTARVTQEDRLKGFEAGADAYIEKPYDPDELDLRVRSLLHQRALLKKMFTEKFESDGMDTSFSEPSISVIDRIFLEKFDAALEEAFVSGKVDCEDLASVMCIGRAQLNRKIKAITGYRTTEYILKARMSKAKILLRTSDLPIGEIALKCGIEDIGYFSTMFRKQVGMTPSAYRNS